MQAATYLISFSMILMKKSNPWKTLSSKIIFQNPWITLSTDDVTTPDGSLGSYTVLEAKPFVIVVAIENGSVVMVEQYRYPVKKTVLEFPAGGIELEEKPLVAAQREFKEETGYEAADWEYVGEFYELVSISRQQGHLFIARDLHMTKDQKMAKDGISRHVLVSFKELEDLIDTGKVIDALTPAVFYKVQLRLAARG
jgi:8-oxo-dGTP pyrophosphatase MutT (NUDIX family)